ncbi:hypothetical protein RIF29_24807 [Crotalaria pallida]|uniref:Uncharacterized protein n=1 Tax=Crotalaria pallida TaxID=3830 RepID=A0AAN9HYR9_CROPI
MNITLYTLYCRLSFDLILFVLLTYTALISDHKFYDIHGSIEYSIQEKVGCASLEKLEEEFSKASPSTIDAGLWIKIWSVNCIPQYREFIWMEGVP